MSLFEFHFTEADDQPRLDVFLSLALLELETDVGLEFVPSRSKVATWVRQGRVQIDAKVIDKPSFRLKSSCRVALDKPAARSLKLEPDSSVVMPIVFEDSQLLVIDKPAGLVVHPGAGISRGTLVNGLIAYLGADLQQIGDALRPGIVHRLDKDTSGLLVVAKTEIAYQGLQKQFIGEKTIKRRYTAVSLPLSGDEEKGEIRAPIGRHPKQRTKMAVIEDGRPARTYWKIIERLGFGCLLEVSLDTGRTHQIRVHFESIKAPLLGDQTYGPRFERIPKPLRGRIRSLGRQALHASSLSFLHPQTGKEVHFETQLPDDLAQCIQECRKFSDRKD